MIIRHVVKEDEANKTIKDILKRKLKISTRLINILKMNQKIVVNNCSIFTNYIVKENDLIELYLDLEEESENIEPQEGDINIIYEDEALIIIDKEDGIVVHPTSLHRNNTLANKVTYYFKQNDIKLKIRPVNRLDRDTSGLIVFAKNQYIQQNMIDQMKTRDFKKTYIGVVNGRFIDTKGTICEPIARCEDSIMKRMIAEGGDISITHYNVLSTSKDYSLIEFELETGRTHQIRVHCGHMGTPLVGDSLYGEEQSSLIKRHALHSYKIEFIHPISNKKVSISSDIPKDILELLKKLDLKYGKL